MTSSTRAPLLSIKEKLNDWYSDYLRQSEESGNTPTESQIRKTLEEKAAEITKEVLSKGDYSSETEQTIKNSVSNYIETNCIPAYKTSLTISNREVNGLEPFEVSDGLKNSTKDPINNISKLIKVDYENLLQDIISSGNVPNEKQLKTYLTAKTTEYINSKYPELNDTVTQYITNKVMSTVNFCTERYGNTVKNINLSVNNKMPFDNESESNEQKKNANSSNLDRVKDTYESFSGCDMVCSISISLPGEKTSIANIVVGYLQTLSYSIHQDKTPVRNIGNMNAKDYTFGPRTIAGSLVFALFNKHWMFDLMELYRQKANISTANHFLVDEMPPFDITITAANEYGRKARMALYGVRLMNEGMVLSINDLYTENTYQYVATNIDYFADTTDLAALSDITKEITSNVSELSVGANDTNKISNTEAADASKIQEINIPNEALLFAGITTKKEAIKKANQEKKRLLAINKANKENGIKNGTYSMQQYVDMEEKIRTTLDAYINQYIPRSGKFS